MCYSFFRGNLPTINISIIDYFKYLLKFPIQFPSLLKLKFNNKIDVSIINTSALFWQVLFSLMFFNKTVLFVRETINPVIVRKFVYYFYKSKKNNLIFVSEFNKSDFVKITGRSENLFVLPSTSESNKVTDIELPKDNKIIDFINKNDFFINIGPISVIKNQELIIDCLIYLANYKNLYLNGLFVGDFDESSSIFINLKNKIILNKLDNNILFTGKLNNSETQSLINRSKFTIISSISEGLPLVISESFKYGKPVIATDVGGIPDVVNKKNGILVKKDVESMANAIIKIYSDKKYYEELSINAIKTFEEKFNLDKNLNEFLKIINNINH